MLHLLVFRVKWASMPKVADYGEFETVPVPVLAHRLFVDGWYEICGQHKFCRAGMWVVQAAGGSGHNLLVPDDVFRESYRPTNTQGEAIWKEQTSKIHPVWPSGKPIDLN